MSYGASQAVSVRFTKFRMCGQIQKILPAELPGYGTLNHRFDAHPATSQDSWKAQHRVDFIRLLETYSFTANSFNNLLSMKNFVAILEGFGIQKVKQTFKAAMLYFSEPKKTFSKLQEDNH